MSEPVPVYQIVLRLGCGGLEKMVVHLARAIDPARYRVTVCCLEDPGELAEELRGTGVSLVALEKRGFEPRVFWELGRRLRRERVRIVHTHNPAAHLYGVIASRLAGVPVVVHTRHGPRADAGCASLFSRWWLWRWTGAVVPVSRECSERFLQRNVIAREKVTLIANGIPVPAIAGAARAALREELAIPPHAPVVGTVARLAPEKDQATLLRAFTRVRTALPDAHLLIVGDGALRGALEAQAAAAGIADRVHFAGFRADVEPMLAAMDLFVLCSTFEGTSLTLLEAMGAHLPVVATDVGGNPEVVGGPENGRLVPVGDDEALSRAVTEALSDPRGTREMAERAYRRMVEAYGVETMTWRYEALYQRLLASSVRVEEAGIDGSDAVAAVEGNHS